MSKNKKNQKKTLGNFYSPYAISDTSTMTEWYKAYKVDPEKEIEIDGRIYRKIINRAEFYLEEEPTLLVDIEPTESLRTGDILADEDGREFMIKCFAMIKYANSFSEWHLKVENILIQGKDYTIGNYLCKLKNRL